MSEKEKEKKQSTQIYGENFARLYKEVINVEILKPSSKWIEWGSNNLYPNYLLSLKEGSPTISAIIKRMTDMVSGLGFEDTNDSKLQSILDNLEGEESLSKVIHKLSYDINIFGMGYLMINWNEDNSYITYFKHVPAEKVRLEKPDENGNINYYYVSPDWKAYRKTENTPVPYAKFNKEDKANKTQIIEFKIYCPGFDYYTAPSYSSSIKYIELESQIGSFHLNNIMNGFAPSMAIQFNGVNPTPEAKARIFNDITEKFCSPTNAGKFLILFNEPGREKAEITPIQTGDNDTKYNLLSEFCTQQILTGSRVTSPELLGIKVPGELGSSDDKAEERFQTNIIAPIQYYIESILNEVLTQIGVDEELVLKTTIDSSEIDGENTPAIDSSSVDSTQTVDPTVNLQQTALNGAQIASLLEVINSIKTGVVSAVSGKFIIKAAFPSMDDSYIDQIVNNL